MLEIAHRPLCAWLKGVAWKSPISLASYEFRCGIFIVDNLYLVIICLFIGLILQRVQRFPKDASVSLNAYVIYVALPAIILVEIPKLTLGVQALIPVVAAWVVMVASALLVFVVARVMRWPLAVTGSLMLTVTLGNTSFVGFPLLKAYLGSGAIAHAILYDQFGTFIALNTFGVIAACYYSRDNSYAPTFASIVKAIVTFPPFIALIAAMILRWVNYPEVVSTVLSRVAETLVPVVMVAVGLQWRFKLDTADLKPLAFGLVACLVFAPLVALGLMKLLKVEGLLKQTIVLEAAMPAMISAGALAISHNLAPRLTAAMVGYGIAFGLVTVWVWSKLL